jgi:hypothetical protein
LFLDIILGLNLRYDLNIKMYMGMIAILIHCCRNFKVSGGNAGRHQRCITFKFDLNTFIQSHAMERRRTAGRLSSRMAVQQDVGELQRLALG